MTDRAPTPGWGTRVTLLAVAIALVLLQHLVAAHQHRPAGRSPGGHATSLASAPVTGPATLLHVHHDGTHPATNTLDHRQPALTPDTADAVALLVPALALLVVAAAGVRGAGRRAASDGRPAPPPPRHLLSRLQVLRV